ncbi:DoxX family protein [Flavobacterium hydatis]|jgi:uncharacterized membrane protein|uniref:Membrane protein n=1 Tax=Flavobacterium hydatis TaxID=991 RepID=A0A086AAB7_FLAHY|nr:membrane protein [Flavobacterium hydatis]KFF13631.1 membrane protein [Flavobacterium hydatis]OXA90282.1 hypothetical protein B0A62_19610 [Flavobacterium hydatis]
MKPLLILLSVFLLSNIAIKLLTQKYDLIVSARIAMFVMLCFTAISHFVFTKGMTMMIPSIIPFKIELVYVTALIEIILGIGLLIPNYSVNAAWILIVFFLILLPANIYAAINHIDFQKGTLNGNGISYLWFRVPLQIFFIAWTYLCAIKIW